MTLTDQLNEIHSLSRAQALEDFEFFCHRVLGLKLPSLMCAAAQSATLKGEVLDLGKYQYALDAWLSANGKREKLTSSPTETFSWLFGDSIESKAA